MNSKPKCIKKQTIYEVSCVYNSYINHYQIPDMSETQWRQAFVEYWNGLPSTKRLKEEQRKQRLTDLVGANGYVIDVLKLMLHYRAQPFVEKHQSPHIKFYAFVKAIENGFISVRVKKPFEFNHCVAVKNGYLIDSIGAQVYPWEGVIKGYKNWEFISAIDTDMIPEPQEPIVVIID